MASREVVIYTTMFCPFCHRAKALLTRKGVAFKEIPVDQDPGARQTMLDRAMGQRTVPQIFIGDRHIGGSDDLQTLEAEGRLDGLLHQLADTSQG
jgi:glutaredoxin 3